MHSCQCELFSQARIEHDIDKLFEIVTLFMGHLKLQYVTNKLQLIITTHIGSVLDKLQSFFLSKETNDNPY